MQTTEAVRQGVIDYLSTRKNLDLDLTQMDLDVTAVSFRENEVDATVSFRPKGSGAGGMNMRYTLERKGNQWVVKNKADAGGSPHGAGGPPAGGGEPALPPGHPAVPPPK